MTRKFFQYFVNGLLISLPIIIICYIFYNLFISLDDVISPVLEEVFGLKGERKIRGLGFIILIALFTLMGFLASTLIARPIRNWLKHLLDKAPLIKTLYKAINDLLSAFVGQKKRFNKPVLVRLSQGTDIHKIGFVTDENLDKLGEIDGKVAVYFPHSYAFSGNLYVVPRVNVVPIDKKPSDVMKYIVSGGVSDLEDDEDNEAK
ncbi:MAG: putative membrane protein [Flavobacteriales bacterium]|jgi:uncharacterized membrane protein